MTKGEETRLRNLQAKVQEEKLSRLEKHYLKKLIAKKAGENSRPASEGNRPRT